MLTPLRRCRPSSVSLYNSNFQGPLYDPDTLFGATYMVIAPEHPFVERLTTELTEAMEELGVDVGALGFAGSIAAVSAAAPVARFGSDADREALLADTEAFIAEVLDAIGDESIREVVVQLARDWLAANASR